LVRAAFGVYGTSAARLLIARKVKLAGVERLARGKLVHRVQHIGKRRKRVKSFIRFLWRLLGNIAEEN